MTLSSKTKGLLAFLIFAFLFGFAQLDSAQNLAKGSVWVENPLMTFSGGVTLGILILAIIGLVSEAIPADLVMLTGAILFVLFGIVSIPQFIEGFANDIIISLGALCIIARGMESCGSLRLVGDIMLPKSPSYFIQLAQILLPLSVLSAFLNNTPIVLMMTSLILDWTKESKLNPSKFLIPISFAAILGGSCTLIGTSNNMVIHALLVQQNPLNGFGFFELAQIGLPCLFVGFFYMVFFGKYLLPDRVDPSVALSEEMLEITHEFLVAKGCPLIGSNLIDAGEKYFRGGYLIEIERGDEIIDSPNPTEVIKENDRLVFFGDISKIAELHSIEGLESTADPHFKLNVSSPHFSEVIISEVSTLIGKTLKKVNFRSNYGASALALFRHGTRVLGRVSDIVLRPGDTLMLLSNQPWGEGQAQSNDFYYLRHNEMVPVYNKKRIIFSIVIIAGMVTSVVFSIPLMLATLVAALLMVIAKVLSYREARKSIKWNILILIGSAFSFGKALINSGIADWMASGILHFAGNEPYWIVASVFFVATLFTEIITNTAASLLIFPIAQETMILAGYGSPSSIKAMAVTIAIACSCAFLTPISYQTNAIVYGPGGYRFTDYFKFGIGLKILLMLLSIYLIPKIWVISA